MIFTKRFSSLIGKMTDVLNRVITLLFLNVTWILFRAGSFGTLRAYLKVLLTGAWGRIDENVVAGILLSYIAGFMSESSYQGYVALFLILLILFVTLFAKNTQEQLVEKGFTAAKLIGCIFVGLLSLLSMSGVSTFLYAYF